MAAHSLTLHQYADNCQIYITTSVSDTSAFVSRFAHCIDNVAVWMSASRLQLNPTKTEVLRLRSKYQVDRIAIQHVPVRSISVKVANTARDFGIYIDRSLTMSDHVAAVCCAAYFQILQLRLITIH